MRYIIIDTDIENCERLERVVSKFSNLQNIGNFTNEKEVMEKIQHIPPDIAFIRIGKVVPDGFCIAKTLQETSSVIQIIFLSENRDYAVDAYDFGADNFLLTPVDERQFNKLISNIQKFRLI